MRYPLKVLYNQEEEELIMSRQKAHHTKQFKLDAINYRKEHPDLTQVECAKNLGIGVSTLARWEAQFRAIVAKEGLGYLLTFDHLVNTSAESGLVFRPLSPRLETRLYLAWNRYQTFTPIAERFLKQVRNSFLSHPL